MTKGIWTLARRTSHSKITGINMELVPPFAAITDYTLLGRLSTRSWDCNSATSISEVGQLGLACSLHSNSSQSCSMGLRSGLCPCQSSSSTPISTNHFCMDLALGHCHAETGKGLPQTVATKLEAQNCLEYQCML